MVAAKIKYLVKKEASKDVFKPASEGSLMISSLTNLPTLHALPCPALPHLDSLQRTANRFRQQLRPQDPKDLEFELEMEHIPDNFFREDVKVSIFVDYDDGS